MSTASGISRRNLFKGAAAAGMALAAAPVASALAEDAAAPGVGTAVARGFGGDVTVTLTVANGAIVDADIDAPAETPERGGRAAEVMQADYVDAGSLEVDGVAGATVTSDAIKTAAAKAYAIATGAAVEASAEVHMLPGQYTASSIGYWGIWDIPVTITVTEKNIIAIEVPEARDLQGETEGFLNPVKEKLFPMIMKYQTTAVDSVVGCTASSTAVKTAIDKALAQALAAGGSDPSAIEAFHVEIPKAELGQVEEIDADIVIVGLSTCGMLSMKAALDRFIKLSKSQNRIKIVGVEKCGKLGGHSFMTHSPNIANPELMISRLENGEKYRTDVEALRADWLAHCMGNDGTQRAKESMVDLYLREGGPTMDWLLGNLGFIMGVPRGTDFSETQFAEKTCWYYYAGGEKYCSSNEDRRAVMMGYYNKTLQETLAAGGQYLLETEGYELIYDEAANEVKGVKARNLRTGKEYVINAGAVIMSTGGFLNDPELQERLLPENLRGQWRQNGNTQNTGTMVKAALNIGAATYNADLCPITMEIGMPYFLQHFPINEIPGKITARTGRVSTWTYNDIPLWLCASCNSLAVGPKGNRLCNEYGIGNGMEDRVPPDTWYAGPFFYSIWSQEQIDKLAAEGFSSANIIRVAAYIQQGGFDKDVPLPMMQEAMDACVDEGLAWKADTIEDLAAQLGMPAGALEATVARYNGFCANGVDEDYGKDAKWLETIGAGPYYAVKAMNVPYGGGGCFDVDEQIRALKADHVTPINGLYIGGQDSFGVVENPDKNYIGYGGVDQGWHVITGRLMGENAAEYVYAKQGLLSQKK